MSRSIRVLVLSDTHGNWPYQHGGSPSVDVLLHCGDLTQVGGLPSLKAAMEKIKSIDAELKLVIAGNHDLDLDEDWVRRSCPDHTEEDLEDSRLCVGYMRSLLDVGIHYLEEGLHKFTLASGHVLSIYASPYTPEFNGYAFAYAKDEDRFNNGPRPIPSDVDIVMTHGPPSLRDDQFGLDLTRNREHVGCEKLGQAVERVKPRLHCFGHIHEGRGAARVQWKVQNQKTVFQPLETISPLPIKEACPEHRETLFVNAAINDTTSDKGIILEMEMGHGCPAASDRAKISDKHPGNSTEA